MTNRPVDEEEEVEEEEDCCDSELGVARYASAGDLIRSDSDFSPRRWSRPDSAITYVIVEGRTPPLDLIAFDLMPDEIEGSVSEQTTPALPPENAVKLVKISALSVDSGSATETELTEDESTGIESQEPFRDAIESIVGEENSDAVPNGARFAGELDLVCAVDGFTPQGWAGDNLSSTSAPPPELAVQTDDLVSLDFGSGSGSGSGSYCSMTSEKRFAVFEEGTEDTVIPIELNDLDRIVSPIKKRSGKEGTPG
jgi:hypothetical protein